MSAVRVTMPPKHQWYAHSFRDRNTGLVHDVVTLQRNYRRSEGDRALCGTLLAGMWRRPPGTAVGTPCERCAVAVAALDDLLPEE